MPEEAPPRQGFTCPWWALWLFDNPLRPFIHNPRQILSGLVSPGQAVMDIGCGMGYFTLTLAELVGEAGQVFAVDLQEEMLAGLRRRAQRRGLMARIRTQRAMPRQIGLNVKVDFALAFWMVHEVADRRGFLSEIRELLSPDAGGKLLVVEPLIHVSGADFKHTVSLAQELGFEPVAWPKIALSRAVVLARRA